MRKFYAVFCLWAAGCLLTPVAGSDEPTKNERRICKVVAPTGTRIAKRTCLTEAQWEQARQIAQEATEKGQVSALMINMAGGGSGG